jgi:hypothetical protein
MSLPIVSPPSVPPAPRSGWWRDGFFWRLRWGAEWRASHYGDRKRAKAITQACRSQGLKRFAETFFAVDAQGRCRFAVRPLFHSGLGIELPLWSQPLAIEICLDLQSGSYRGQRAVLGVELLTSEQVRQIDAGASLVLGGFFAHFERDTRVALDAPRDLSDPGDTVFVERMTSARARERGIGLSEFAHAKGVAGKLLGTAATTYWDWPDQHGRRDWTKLTPRIGAVRRLTELITGTSLTEDEVKALWTASERNPPFHPTLWPNSKT